MSKTITYEGWLSLEPVRRAQTSTIILAPNKYFYRAKKHVLIDQIRTDVFTYGSFINIKIWCNHHKIKPEKKYEDFNIMGYSSISYNEIWRSTGYDFTSQYMYVDTIDMFMRLLVYQRQYVILEITFHKNEHDMIAHETERILLRD